MKSKAQDLAILIPTKNRSEDIEKQLRYFLKKGFAGQSIIADSSDQDDTQEIVHVFLKKQSRPFDLTYYRENDISANRIIDRCTPKITKPYSMLCPDDDIIFVDSINRMTEFLDINDDFSAVGGKAYRFKFDNVGVKDISFYPLFSSYADSSVDRLTQFLLNTYLLDILVTRTDVFADGFRTVHKLSNFDSSFIVGELCSGAVVCLNGKVGTLNIDFYSRRLHAGQFSSTISKESR